MNAPMHSEQGARDWASIVYGWTLHECSGVCLSSLPPLRSDHIALKLCKFRMKPYALCYGGCGGHGIGYEWLGIRLEIGINQQ